MVWANEGTQKGVSSLEEDEATDSEAEEEGENENVTHSMRMGL